MRGPVAALILLAGCSPAKQAEDRPATQVEPAREDPSNAARKRACIEALTSDAEPRLHTLLRSLCAESVEHDIPGISLAVVDFASRATPIQIEIGVRCVGEPSPIDAATMFRIGSVSKTLSAALALGLIEARDDLSRTSDATLIPSFASQTELPPPQLGALLRHRSGLGEIEPATLVELDGAWLPALAQASAAGPPGEYHYSNAGYSVIGAMLEAATAQPYAELVDGHIAEPLELAKLTADQTAPTAACGHGPDRQPIPIREDLEFMPGDPSWMVPAGGLLSSATDLAQFALALGSDRLPGTAAMLEPGDALPPAHAHPAHQDERYGDGLRSWTLDDTTHAYGHKGNNGTFTAQLLFVPHKRAIVILSNSGADLPATTAAAESLLASP